MKIAYSFVVDARAKFEWQAFLLTHSLLRNAGCNPQDIKIHVLPGVSSAFRNALIGLGVLLVPIQPFDDQHPHCNKIQQCFSPAIRDYDKVALLDCDLFFLSPPRLPAAAVLGAKIVDMENPPLEILRNVHQAAGIPLSENVPIGCALSEGEITLRSNLNGGFYLVDRTALDSIGRAWKEHARWLLERIELLGAFEVFVDQIAMGLAIDELKLSISLLPTQLNFPTHLTQARLEVIAAPDIQVLHYHSNLLPGGRLRQTGLPTVDAAIERANRDIDSIVADNFRNELFWGMRYDLFPELGSGLGSRGETLQYKQERLRNSAACFANSSVLDVGCGDLETTRSLDFANYTGYDLSESALKIAARKRPDWSFVHGMLPKGERADLVICLDVLIHQKTASEYFDLMTNLVNAAEKRLIVSGFEKMPVEYTSNIVSFQEPLSESLARFGVFSEVFEVGQYRETSMMVADKRATGPGLHNHDMPTELLTQVLPRVDRKDLLRLVMDVSREYLGFFTKTPSRALEYPWLWERAMRVDAGGRVLDIGAGVSPLPVMLAKRGIFVDTVDAHPLVRDLTSKSSWNEWGYFDYSALSSNIHSFHRNILEFRSSLKYDLIYSISVLEHLRREDWEQTLRLCSTWLGPGGLLLLTMDLIPGTDSLWNLSEGRVVEPNEQHGTLRDMERLLGELGFVLEESDVERGIPGSKTDVAFLACRFR